MMALAGYGTTSSIGMFAYYPSGILGFSYSTFYYFLGAFLLSFLPPFLAFSASYYFFFFSYYFFFYSQSNSVLVTNLLIVIESSQSLNYSAACLS
jgi:hypothetical protein